MSAPTEGAKTSPEAMAALNAEVRAYADRLALANLVRLQEMQMEAALDREQMTYAQFLRVVRQQQALGTARVDQGTS